MGSHFQFYGLQGLLKVIHRIINSGDSQLVKKTPIPRGGGADGGQNSVRFTTATITSFRFPNFTDLRNF